MCRHLAHMCKTRLLQSRHVLCVLPSYNYLQVTYLKGSFVSTPRVVALRANVHENVRSHLGLHELAVVAASPLITNVIRSRREHQLALFK